MQTHQSQKHHYMTYQQTRRSHNPVLPGTTDGQTSEQNYTAPLNTENYGSKGKQSETESNNSPSFSLIFLNQNLVTVNVTWRSKISRH